MKVFSIHVDIDVTRGKSLDATDFSDLYLLADIVTFIIDIHITRDWDGNGRGWEEPMDVRDMQGQSLDGMNLKAEVMRDAFVESLSCVFEAHGKLLRMA